MSHHTRLWWAHTRWALFCFILLATALDQAHWDQLIAHRLFFDAATPHWRGTDSFWINSVIHSGGRWAIRALVFALLATWIATARMPRLAQWRRPTAYACIAMTLSIALIGLLKQLTNIDCPWDLSEFGGHAPYVALFAARAASLAHAHCFPAAHASSGYALFAFYFALRERHAQLARWSIGAALLTGLCFGIAQQARGAHFLSHDVWSAFLTWMTALALYVFAFRARLWPHLHDGRSDSMSRRPRTRRGTSVRPNAALEEGVVKSVDRQLE
jgi:membrane-associated PAP2 superfamily phosphatase